MPTAAVPYCQQLGAQYAFEFRVVRPRQTRLGDFRVLPTGTVRITVNADLPPPAFLITYLHEVAHVVVHRTHTSRFRRPKPHGPAWQRAFQALMQPMLNDTVFPPNVVAPLRAYMQRPAATTSAHPALMQALRLSDPGHVVAGTQRTINQLAEGDAFYFRKKLYIRGAVRRTRVVCKEVASGRSYAILAHACIDPESVLNETANR